MNGKKVMALLIAGAMLIQAAPAQTFAAPQNARAEKEKEESYMDGANGFAFRLTDELLSAKKSGENLLVSPYSVWLPLAALVNGSDEAAKKEMLKIPLLSQWMVQVNCLFMDRQNVKEGLKTILQGIEKIKRGVSIWIFPEGTRNRNEKETDLLPFKEGSLKIAEKTGCPVIPVAITGTADVFEKHLPFIRPAHVTIEFGEPFFVKELPPEQKKFPGAYTRDRILEMLEKEQHGLTGDQEAAGQH